MSVLNRGWLYDSLTRNQESGSVSYRWTHELERPTFRFRYFLLLYSLLLERSMCMFGKWWWICSKIDRDCMWELQETDIIKNGEVYVIDWTNGFNGNVDWDDSDSFLRKNFNPKFINTTTERKVLQFLCQERY